MAKKSKKTKKGLHLALTADAADALFVELLQYWYEMFKPRKGRWNHPDDVPREAERRAAIKVLLDFMEA